MPGGIGIDPDYDYLYDPQMAKVWGFCEQCGGEIYTPGERLCSDCRKERRNA